MITVQTSPARSLPEFAADQMSALTKPGSLNQRWLSAIAAGSPDPEMPEDLTYSWASRDQDYEIEIIGWACILCWNGHPCLEGFVHTNQRGKGLATALSTILCLSTNVPRQRVGVFSPEFVKIAKTLGFKEIIYYRRVDDGWLVCDPDSGVPVGGD
jgi:hypothetical protein